MFTVEASYTVPVSIAIILFIISMTLYLHDIILIDTSVKEAALMWKCGSVSESDIKKYLDKRTEKIYVLSQTVFSTDINESEIQIVGSSKADMFYSVVYYLLSGRSNRTMEFKASAEKSDPADNLRYAYGR